MADAACPDGKEPERRSGPSRCTDSMIDTGRNVGNRCLMVLTSSDANNSSTRPITVTLGLTRRNDPRTIARMRPSPNVVRDSQIGSVCGLFHPFSRENRGLLKIHTGMRATDRNTRADMEANGAVRVRLTGKE